MFKACISLLIFFLDDLCIGISGMLKSPTIIVLLSISPFMVASICLYVLRCSYSRCVNIYNCSSFLLGMIPWSLYSILMWCPSDRQGYLVWYEYCSSSFDFHLHGTPFPTHFQSVCVPRSEVGLFCEQNVYTGV